MNNRIKWFFIIIFGIFTDQLSKYAAIQLFSRDGDVSLLWGTLQFTLIHNPGGFLSVFSELPSPLRFLLLNIGVGGLLAGCLYYIFLYAQPQKRYCTALAWVTSGGLSNLLDRLVHEQGVIDFVSIGIGSFRTGIFNFADVFILIGSFYLGLNWGQSKIKDKTL